MSRSYKKSPYCTDGHCRTTKEMKQIANRSVRRRNKRITLGYLTRDRKYRDELTLDGVFYKRFFNCYNIHDYISRWTKAEAIHEWEHPVWHYFAARDIWWTVWEDYKTREDMEQYWAKWYRRK